MGRISRREWLWAAACWADVLRAQTPGFTSLDSAMAREIEAIAEEILPGARQAGVVYFIDRALAGYDQDQRELYRAGLAAAQQKRAALFPSSASIATLQPSQRIELLKAIESTGFFQQVRVHTVLGYFGHPKHGGNRGGEGARLLGIEESMHFQPPFGFYDKAETG